MSTEVTRTDYAGRMDPRESGQEYAEGTVDLGDTGTGSITVDLTGELSALGMGLLTEVTADEGTASLSDVSPDSVTIAVSGGTAGATDVGWQLIVSEDGFSL